MQSPDVSNKYLLSALPDIVLRTYKKNVSSLKFIGGGSYGRVFRAELSDGEIIAVKAYRVHGSQHIEAAQLQLLSEATSVEMPSVLFTYEDEKAAVLGMSFVKGKNVLSPSFLFNSRQKKAKFAESVTEGMLQWHSVEGEKFGSVADPSYDTWLSYYKEEKQKPWLEGLGRLADEGKFSKKSLQLLKDATDIFNKLPENESKPVLIHSDLNIMNIMADPKTLALTAFIDPCDSLWADREYDLFQLRNMWGDSFGLYSEYKKKYPLSEYADFRIAYYGAMNEAHCRLGGGLIMPLWEILNFRRLKKEMKRLSPEK